MKRDIKCVYYTDDIESDTEPDYTYDAVYLMIDVHKRDNKIWVDKINDKLYFIRWCSPEYYQYKLAEERDKKIEQILKK